MAADQIIEEIEKRLMFSCNIMHNEHCINWLTEAMVKGDESQDVLFSPNVESFKKIFGKYQFSFNLDKEYFVWRLSKGNEKMYCIAHEEGTFYQVFYSSGKTRFASDEKMGGTIVEFLDYVLERLTSATH